MNEEERRQLRLNPLVPFVSTPGLPEASYEGRDVFIAEPDPLPQGSRFTGSTRIPGKVPPFQTKINALGVWCIIPDDWDERIDILIYLKTKGFVNAGRVGGWGCQQLTGHGFTLIISSI